MIKRDHIIQEIDRMLSDDALSDATIRAMKRDELAEKVSIFFAELEAQHEELQEKQHHLSELSDKFRRLFALSPTGLIHCDNQLTIHDANTLAMTYLNASDVKGRSLGNLLRKQYGPFMKWFEGRACEAHPLDMELGDAVLRFYCHAVDDQGYLFAILDVSEEVRAKQAQQALNEALNELNASLEARVEREVRARIEEMEKRLDAERILQSKSRQIEMVDMIGNIAHQWRQPLNVLAITIQKSRLLFNKGRFDKTAMQDLQSRAEQIIQQLSSTLDLFRNYLRPSEAMLSIDPNRETAKALQLIDAQFANLGIDLDVQLDGTTWVRGYENELTQVVLNLLSNAKDACEEAGGPHRRVLVRSRADAQQWTLDVQDNGGGIDEGIIDRVFDPYFTTKHQHFGTGLGLYMSREIIQKIMQGTIRVENIEGGARFRITLPTTHNTALPEQKSPMSVLR